MLNGLLVHAPLIDLIWGGSRTWEIRGTRTSRRGRIALMQSGTGTVIGVPELVDVVVPLTLAEHAANVSKAGFPKNERISRLPYPRTLGWVLQRPHHLKQPVPYADPYGAVIWVISRLPSNAPFFNNWGGPDDQRASMTICHG
jgi:hypothetical protein